MLEFKNGDVVSIRGQHGMVGLVLSYESWLDEVLVRVYEKTGITTQTLVDRGDLVFY